MKGNITGKPDWLKDIKAIGWDLDGTLYPSDAIPGGLIREKQIEVITKINSWTSEMAKMEFQKKLDVLGSNTKSMSALGVDGPAFFREFWEKLPFEKYVKRDNQLIEMFASLKAYRHFIVSNSNQDSIIIRKLAAVGLSQDFFEVIVSTDKLGAVKPDPEPFMVALNEMGLQSNQTLYVGDRVETDIVGARGVGMRTCLVGSESKIADVSLPQVYAIGDLLTLS